MSSKFMTEGSPTDEFPYGDPSYGSFIVLSFKLYEKFQSFKPDEILSRVLFSISDRKNGVGSFIHNSRYDLDIKGLITLCVFEENVWDIEKLIS